MKYSGGPYRPLTKEEDKKADIALYKFKKKLLSDRYCIIFSTCNGAADARLNGTFFKLVVIDEAAQDTEPSTIILFICLHISGRVTLLGDPCQLGPCITSKEADSCDFGQTLFERLYNMNLPYPMLDEQYRMHPDIGSLVSPLTYENTVGNRVEKKDRLKELPKTFLTIVSGFLIAWINVTGLESADENSRSMQNMMEARAVVNLAATLIGVLKMKSNEIVIITSYSAQVKRIQKTVQEACEAIEAGTYLKNRFLTAAELEADLKKVRIGTVGGFQGQESDIVIYNIVRSNPYFSIGFLENYKCLNVAISRAGCLLFIVRNATMFPSLESGRCFINKEIANNRGRAKWRTLLEWCIENRCTLNANGVYEQLPHERLWPCIGVVGLEGQQAFVQKMMSSEYAITISIREHLMTEFRIVCLPAFYQEKCDVYLTPSTTYVAGWGEIIVSNMRRSKHDQMLKFVREKLQFFDNLETRKCFLEPTVANRGESCQIKKSEIFRDNLNLPPFMDNWHYRDPEYAEKYGLKVLGRHRIMLHVHIRHDIFRLLLGPLSKPPCSLYEKFCENNIAFISEYAQYATLYEFIWGYITTKRKYNPRVNWTLERSYGYLVYSLRQLLTEWASWNKNRDARREANRLAVIARQMGHNISDDLFF